MPRCECPELSERDPVLDGLYDPVTEEPFRKHAPGECRCTNDLALYDRNGKQMWLCSMCCLPEDRRIEQ